MNIALETLGCKLNQAETESIARQLVGAGHTLVKVADKADIYILNTCTVTQTADAKARQLLRAAHRRNPDSTIVVTGCYAQRAPQVVAEIEGVNLVVGNNEKQHLLPLLQEAKYLSSPTYHKESTPTGQSLMRTRAFIKIQDGCGNFCAYCVVPLVRTKESSLPTEQIIAEIKQQAANGYKEVVLTGTKVGSYHHNNLSIKDLLERILSETSITRIRLSSLQPQEISPQLIRLWQDSRLCPHFHLSLQSGSDAVLNRMKRRYSVDQFQETVSLLRTEVPNVAITTDVIVGFPGETEEYFTESYELCRQLQFARIHVFSYSPRQGTTAANMPQLEDRIKRERSQQMLALARDSAQNFRQQFSGKKMAVLWEQPCGKGVWSGLTGNYIRVFAKNNNNLTNKLLPAKLINAKGDGVCGEV